MSLVSASNLARAYGAQDIFADVGFEIHTRERIALVGVNGAGKSTLLRLLARVEPVDRGALSLPPRDRVGYLPQEVTFAEGMTLQTYLDGAFAHVRQLEAELRNLEDALASPPPGVTIDELLTRHSDVSLAFEAADGYAYQHRVHETIAGLGIPEAHLEREVTTFSGGQRTRAALARLLLSGSDLLLLDEPTNHLDVDATEWLEGFLTGVNAAVVVVSHDRYFLDAVATRTWEIADGNFETYTGNYTQFARQRAEREARKQRDFATQQAHIARTEAFIRRYRAGVKARQARGRQKQLDRLGRVGPPRTQGQMNLAIRATLRAGDTVLAFENLGIAPEAPVGNGLLGQTPGMPFVHESNAQSRALTPLVHLPDIEVARGERVAIVGPNGAGKTTLLRVIMGELVPVRGRVHIGYGVQIAYYAQAHEQLDPKGTVMTEVTDGHAMSETEARTYLGRFLFTGDDVFKAVRALSGGERSRLALAKLALSTANVLILDEPTNHLDIYSREALEGVLDQFDGTIIFVSHDRFFIDGLSSQIWEVADGKLTLHRGTWSEVRAARHDVGKRPAKLDDRNGLENTSSVPEPARKPAQAQSRPTPAARPTANPREVRAARERSEKLGRELAKLETDLQLLDQEIDASSRSGDGVKLVELGARHVVISEQLRAAEERWLDAQATLEALECVTAT